MKEGSIVVSQSVEVVFVACLAVKEVAYQSALTSPYFLFFFSLQLLGALTDIELSGHTPSVADIAVHLHLHSFLKISHAEDKPCKKKVVYRS